MKTLIQFDQDETFLRYFVSALRSAQDVVCEGVTKNLRDVLSYQKDGKRADIYVLALNALGLDTQSIVSRVRSIAPNATIVGLVEHDNPDVRAVAMDFGADKVIVKHNNFVELTRQVLAVAQNKPEFQQYQGQQRIPTVASFEDEMFQGRGVPAGNGYPPQQQMSQGGYPPASGQGQAYPQQPPMPQQNPGGYPSQNGGQTGYPPATQPPQGMGDYPPIPQQQQGYQQAQSSAQDHSVQGAGQSRYVPSFDDYAQPAPASQNVGDGVKAFVQKTIVVGGAKGGTGKTTIAIELASALALVRPSGSTQKLKVCLVDLDLDYGDVRVAMNLPRSPYTIFSWAEDIKERAKVTPFDSLRYPFSEVKKWLSQSEETGLYVLPAPFNPIQGADITYEEVSLMLNQLKGLFDIVVLDVGNNTKDYTIAAYEACTDAMLVVTPDLACLKDTHVMLQALREVDVDTSNFVVVANKVHAGTGRVNVKEIENAVRNQMGVRFAGQVPKLDIVEQARNSGQVLSVSKTNEFTAQVRVVGNEVIRVFGKSAKSAAKPGANPNAKKTPNDSKSFFGRLFGRG